jgi:hypothetical protein
MLEIQKTLLSGTSPAELQESLGIRHHVHPEIPIIGFTYHQIDSPKTHPIVREARGICLEKDTWKIVGKSFNRFFNLGEVADEYKDFDWSQFICYTKADGSLMLLYYYGGTWRIKTRGSFATGAVPFPLPGEPAPSFGELFWRTLKADPPGLTARLARLNPQYTYVLEMCSKFNQVVRLYSKPCVYLLSVFDNATGAEVSDEEAAEIAKEVPFERPEVHPFTSLEEIERFLKQQEEDDHTFEGVIVRDSNNLRYKIKSETYRALHHMLDNGNLYSPKCLVPYALTKDPAKMLEVYPHAKDHLDAVVSKVTLAWIQLLKIWEDNWQIENQKEFALAVARKTPFVGLLFQLRKQKGGVASSGGFLPGNQTELELKELWRNNGAGITKTLFK